MVRCKVVYLAIVSTECPNVLVDPLHGSDLVLETQIQCTLITGLVSLRKSERADAIIEADVDDWRPLELRRGFSPNAY